MNVKRPLFNYLVLLLAMFVFSELQAQQISRELIIREFGRLKFLSKESATQLAFDDVQGSSAVSERQGRKVTINLPELHRLANRTAPIYTTAVVRMVLAHEMAHQMQYTHEQGKNSPVVNECQADLVCGFLIAQQFFYDFVTKLIENENKSVTNELIKEGTERLNNVSIVVFSSIFLLGDDFNPDNTHPRNDQRLAALRDGLSYGAMYLMYENFNLLPNDLKISTKTSMDSIKKVLNFWENENVITWSQKHARRITHENINHCKDIVVYNEWSWDTAKSHPYLSYAQTIKNIGNKKIYLNFYNQIRTKVRTKPDSVFYWQTTATNSHIATLGPGATKSLSDSLKWYGDRVVMPSVLLFGNPNSLYTCTCSDDAQQTTSEMVGNHMASPQSVPRLSTIVDQVISESDNFEPYVGSVGIIVVKGSKRIAYDSRRKLPGAITNHIIRVLDLPRLFLRSEFYRGVQSAKAVQIANTIITQLKEINIICENKNNGINKSWGVFLNQKLVGMLAVDKLTDQYVVQLEIYDHQDRR